MAWYCTREDVKAVLDSKTTARDNIRVDRAIESASRNIEGQLHRKFYPQLATRYFDWPSLAYQTPWRLWLGPSEVISVSSLVAGGTTIAAADYFLSPDTGPPYTSIEIDLSSTAAFASGSTAQRSIAITGLFGYTAVEESVGTLTAQLAASLTATASVSFTTARVGVGDLIKIDSEYVFVTEKTMVDSTQNLQTSLTASASNVTVAVTNGAAFDVDTVLLIDSERMLVVDIAGNNLTVKRAWDGSVLAAHTAPTADIYTQTGIEIDRAQCGSVLAVHNSSSVLYRHVVPGPIRDLCIAEVINTGLQEGGGYSGTSGSGDTSRDNSGGGLGALRAAAWDTYGRKVRMASV